MLPADIKQERSGLLLAQAWMAFFRLDLAQVPSILEQVDSLLEGITPDSILLGELHFFRGMIQFYGGDIKSSLRNFEQGLAHIQQKQLHVMCRTEYHLAMARYLSGQKALAIKSLEDRIRSVGSSKGLLLSFLIGGLVWIRLLAGELAQAEVQAKRVQTVVRRSRIPNTEAWISYLRACIYFHSTDLDRASKHFADAIEQRHVIHAVGAIQAFAGLAITRQLMRQPDDTAQTIEQLLNFVRELNIPEYLSVARSCKARLSILYGDLVPAVQWEKSLSEAPTPMTLYIWLEVPVITQSRVLIAEGSKASLAKATELLDSLRKLAQTYRFTNQTIEVEILQSVALDKLGRGDEALASLKEVVALAGPLGWIRPFAEAGSPMVDLLMRLRKQNVSVDHINRILAALPGTESIPTLPDLRTTNDDLRFESKAVDQTQNPKFEIQNSLVEPLTHSELDVLELLAQRLQNKEIADKLFVSPETVKAHLHNIYQKLNVSKRREAIEKAKKIGILDIND